MKQELHGLMANYTFTFADLPPVRKGITGRWVYRRKVNQHNRVVRATSRLVIKVFVHADGVDCFDTYAPSPIATFIRLVTGVAGKNGVRLSHLDIQKASVQAPLEEEVWVELPSGCAELTRKILELKTSLHSVKEVLHEFHTLLMTKLHEYGFQRISLTLASSG